MMAERGSPERRTRDFSDRMATLRKSFLHGLDAHLDVEAGLREVMLCARHKELAEGLDAVLDIEAGLVSVLSRGTARTEFEEAAAPLYDVGLMHQRFELIGPEQRLVLRGHPLVTSAILADLLIRTVVLAQDLTYGLGFGRYHGMPLQQAVFAAQGVARGIAQELDRRAALAWDLRDLAHEIVALLEPHYPEIDRARRVGQLLVREMVTTIDKRVRTADHPAIAEFLRACEVFMFAVLGGDLTRAVREVQYLSRVLVEQVGELLELGEPENLDLEFLAEVLDDFTTADLTSVDLAGVDLAGVRWSELRTRWPAAISVDQLRADSRETLPGSGIYIVRPGTGTRDVTRV
ncbi:hypothetical protein [Streptomyces sp. NRRL S-495]|uniref:hypothetical protein n=1 Tax=Streptomyces sp. NRRL S-495 TaxID=1609133 RepID=UPI001331561F|nr:hypothetical protein [Streptomyces sp. NRRL S-495]